MEESESPPSPNPNPNPNPKKPSLCEECGLNPWKYSCPGCSIHTCSLPCVKSHKQRSGCTGQKNRSQFVPISQFNDQLLLSDYNLLEETKRVAESARRCRMRAEFGGNPAFRLPRPLWLLRGAARRRRTHLLLLPSGMSKRERNHSRYDKRKNSIFWTIEWRFHSTNVVLINHGIDEQMSLDSVVQNLLKPGPWNHPLRPFCNENLDNLSFFIQKNPKDPSSPFRKLNIRSPLGQQMANVVVIEYPVVYVFLPSDKYDFDVEKDDGSFSNIRKPAETCDTIPSPNVQSPRGVLFKEEEIKEDDASCNTHIMDFMEYVNSEAIDSSQNQTDIRTAEITVARSDMLISRAGFEGSKPISGNKGCAYQEETDGHSKCTANSLMFSKDMDFDFEQDLRDAYSDLIGEINPDDFLCLDGVYNNEGEMEEINSDFHEALLVEELEEGEIPS